MRNQVYTLLAKCRDQFRFYAVQHQQKNPPQEDKARVNAAIADEIEAQLNIRDPDNDHATMVTQLQKPGQDILKNMTPRMAARSSAGRSTASRGFSQSVVEDPTLGVLEVGR